MTADPYIPGTGLTPPTSTPETGTGCVTGGSYDCVQMSLLNSRDRGVLRGLSDEQIMKKCAHNLALHAAPNPPLRLQPSEREGAAET